MFLRVTVVAFIILVLIMATQYAEESKQILERWGFLCGKKERQVRNPRIEVSQVGDFMKGEDCNLPWKHIQLDDQVLKINGLPVAHLDNFKIRAMMLLSCSANSEESNETTVFSVEFTNATIQHKELGLLSQKDKKTVLNKSRPAVRTKKVNKKFEGLSPKEKRSVQNKERIRHSVSAKKDGG